METRVDWETGSDLTILAMKDSLSEWDDCDTKYQARPARADVVGNDILCSPSVNLVWIGGLGSLGRGDK